jgi:hypothetical protein
VEVRPKKDLRASAVVQASAVCRAQQKSRGRIGYSSFKPMRLASLQINSTTFVAVCVVLVAFETLKSLIIWEAKKDKPIWSPVFDLLKQVQP